jgi:uncharacterized membrane protein YqjE
MPGEEAGPSSGRGGLLRELLGAALGLLGTHVELLGVELQEEKERLRELLLLAVLAGASLTLGLLLASVFLVVLFWDSYRLQVLGALVLAWLGLSAWTFAALRRRLADHPNTFAASVAELDKDRQRLKRES